jgi:uncharacterized protein
MPTRRAIIDVHTYIGAGLHVRQTAAELLREMDQNDVAHSIISTVDQFVAVYNREGNNEIAAAARAHSDRLTGFAVVNPWYGPKGIDELRRCVDSGLRGLVLDTRMHACFFTDTIVFDLVAVAAKLKLPVYCHTGTPIHSLPIGLMELALHFPESRFVLGSVGYADGWYDVLPATTNAPNIFIDTSHGSQQIIEAVITKLGPERVLFGSDSPVSSLAAEILKVNLLEISDDARAKVFGGNAAEILGVCL